MAYPEIEFRSKAEIELFQNEELHKLLEYLQGKSRFYGRLFRDHK